MAKVKITFNNDVLNDLVTNNKYIIDDMRDVAEKVLYEAIATAQEAQNGPDGTLTGYAEAGFEVKMEKGRERVMFKIISKAESAIAMAAHFNSQRKDGIGHLRAALYKFVSSKNYSEYPAGKKYTYKKGK